MAIVHPDFSILANRIVVQNLHDSTMEDITEVAKLLMSVKDKAGRPAQLLSDDTFKVIMEHGDKINEVIDYSRDFTYDFFGFKTLEKAYLLKIDGKIAERP